MRKDQKNILIIGAGHQQIPAIKTAKKMGLCVVSVDRNPSAPGIVYSDIFYPLDIMYKSKILDIALKHNVRAVMTMQSDLPVPTVGYINSSMNLSGIREDAARFCSNKKLTRELFLKNGVNQPDFQPVDNLSACISSAKNIGFPCIIKPVDSSGSRGVSLVNKESEVQIAYHKAKRFSVSGVVMVEEYITGTEIGAQTFSVDGVCHLVCIHNDVICSGEHKMPVGHSYPFLSFDSDVDCLRQEIQKAISCLGIHNGPANVDIILSEDGIPNIIEVGARIGSNALPELTSYYLGIDWVEYSIRSALGDPIHFSNLSSNPCAANMLCAPKTGILSDVMIPDWIYNNRNLIALEMTARKGDIVYYPTEGTHMIGKVIVSGPSVLSAQKLADKISREIVFKVNDPQCELSSRAVKFVGVIG